MTDSLQIGWKTARKRPVQIKFREVIPDQVGSSTEIIETREGKLVATKGTDFVIQGVEGELYPITKTTFYKTYEVKE